MSFNFEVGGGNFFDRDVVPLSLNYCGGMFDSRFGAEMPYQYLMCHDDLPKEERLLIGSQFSYYRKYLQVTLKPCDNDGKLVCATKEEQEAFYRANPKLHFLYVDNTVDLRNSTKLFKDYVNTDNYVSVDQDYLTSVNFFVRKMKIEGQPD